MAAAAAAASILGTPPMREPTTPPRGPRGERPAVSKLNTPPSAQRSARRTAAAAPVRRIFCENNVMLSARRALASRDAHVHERNRFLSQAKAASLSVPGRPFDASDFRRAVSTPQLSQVLAEESGSRAAHASSDSATTAAATAATTARAAVAVTRTAAAAATFATAKTATRLDDDEEDLRPADASEDLAPGLMRRAESASSARCLRSVLPFERSRSPSCSSIRTKAAPKETQRAYGILLLDSIEGERDREKEREREKVTRSRFKPCARYAQAMLRELARAPAFVTLGLDLGGTLTKLVIATPRRRRERTRHLFWKTWFLRPNTWFYEGDGSRLRVCVTRDHSDTCA